MASSGDWKPSSTYGNACAYVTGRTRNLVPSGVGERGDGTIQVNPGMSATRAGGPAQRKCETDVPSGVAGPWKG